MSLSHVCVCVRVYARQMKMLRFNDFKMANKRNSEFKCAYCVRVRVSVIWLERDKFSDKRS